MMQKDGLIMQKMDQLFSADTYKLATNKGTDQTVKDYLCPF